MDPKPGLDESTLTKVADAPSVSHHSSELPTSASLASGDVVPAVNAQRPNAAAGGSSASTPENILSPAQQPDEIGRLAEYRVLAELGRGGMGAVFQAEDPKLMRMVALKVMLPHVARDESNRLRFLREAQAAAQLEHDHIVTIYQVGEANGVPFIAMPFLKGESLHSRLRREPSLPIADVACIGRQIAEGLAAAHERGLVHRDIKPGNIWLESRMAAPGRPAVPNSEGKTAESGHPTRVKILDFGLALLPTSGEAHLTTSGTILGTPAYMAPEQARGSHGVDFRCDLFSLGAVLYRMTTGQQPFTGDTAFALLTALAVDTPSAPSRLNGGTPPELNDLILQLLAKQPNDRPASAREVAERLAAVEQSARQHARRGSPDPAASPDRRSPKNSPTTNANGDLRSMPSAGSGDPRTAHGDPRTARTQSLPAVNPEVSTLVLPETRQRRRRKTMLSGLILLAAVVLAGIIIKIKHKDGTITEIKVPGDATVEITSSDPSSAKSKSEISNLKSQIPAAPERADIDPQRRAAEAILEASGTMFVLVGPTVSHVVNVTKPEELPEKPFVLYRVDLTNRREWTDQHQQLLRDVPWLFTLNLTGTSITDDGLSPVSDLAGYGLNLKSTKVTDFGIQQLGKDMKLNQLILTNTNISDAACATIGAMPRLKNLHFGGTTITDAGVRELGRAKQLRFLLTDRKLTEDGLKALVGLPRLLFLHLILNNFDGTDLERLWPAVEQMKSLRLVVLRPGHADRARQLQSARPELVVAHQDVPLPEAELAAMRWLLSHNARLSGTKSALLTEGAITLEDLSSQPLYIVTLDFRIPTAPETGIAQLRGLRYLEDLLWPRLRLDDDVTEQLAAMISLRSILADGRKLSPTGLARLTSLPNLEMLALYEASALSDDDFKPLSSCASLHRLLLSRSTVRDGALIHIARCPNLDWLELENCKELTHEGLTHLESLQWLWMLDLFGNSQLDDRAVEPLSRLKSLRLLFLSGTSLTPDAITRLSRALPRCAIFWNGPTIIPGPKSPTVEKKILPR